MLGIDPLTISSLLVLAASGAGQCIPAKATEINVIPSSKEVVYDTSQTLAQLQGKQIDTINPYGFHGVSQTQGYMSGSIRMTPSVKIDYTQDPQTGELCIWYDTVDIKIEIEPTIVIAKEVYADRCKKKAVMDHELKHVQADREIVNKYSKIMGKKVFDGLKKRGFKVGPVPAANGQGIADRMQETVIQIVGHEYKKMDLERAEVQGAIDSLEEYERVSSLCP